MITAETLPSQFYHAPGLISVILFEYFAIVALFTFYHKCRCKCCKLDEIPPESGMEDFEIADNDIGNTATPAITIPRYNFNDTFESCSPRLRYILFLHRIISFYYICGVSVAANYVINGGHRWFYFPIWNVELLSIYYMLATCASIIGFVYSKNHRFFKSPRDDEDDHKWGRRRIKLRITRVIWSRHSIRFGKILHVLFQVCGGSAVFITLVNFATLDHEPSFWNISIHLVPLLTLLIELFLNNMDVRMDHLPFNLSWLILFFIFIWPVVIMGRISGWPYEFLALDRPICYAWYSGVVFAHIQCYIVFYAIFRLRDYLRDVTMINERDGKMKNDKLPELVKEIEGEIYIHDKHGNIRRSIRLENFNHDYDYDNDDDEENKDQFVEDSRSAKIFHRNSKVSDDPNSRETFSRGFSTDFGDKNSFYVDNPSYGKGLFDSLPKGAKRAQTPMDEETSEPDEYHRDDIHNNYKNDSKSNDNNDKINEDDNCNSSNNQQNLSNYVVVKENDTSPMSPRIRLIIDTENLGVVIPAVKTTSSGEHLGQLSI